MTPERLAAFRSAAKAVRAGRVHDLPALMTSLADWLDGEAAILGEMEPFAELINATISSAGGPSHFLRFGRDSEGQPKLVGDTSEASSAVVASILGTEEGQ